MFGATPKDAALKAAALRLSLKDAGVKAGATVEPKGKSRAMYRLDFEWGGVDHLPSEIYFFWGIGSSRWHS